MKQINVIQIIDALAVGGAERLAVSYANGLRELDIQSHLCVTRAEGPLKQHLTKDVGYIFLERKKRFDFPALFRLRAYMKEHNISIIHAHATSYFIAIMLKMIMPSILLIFHDHYGDSEFLSMRHDAKKLKMLAFMFDHYIGVNTLLVDWARDYLNISINRITYLSNYPRFDNKSLNETQLKGTDGKRILSLANYRPQKDHHTLIYAFKMITDYYPEWTLHLVGLDNNDTYSKDFKNLIISLNLEEKVFIYGGCNDIYNVLKQSNMGVLSSKSEGLPIALLEYGLSGLPVICTKVGECATVLENGEHGILIESEDSNQLALAFKNYIDNPTIMKKKANSLHEHIQNFYSEESVLQTLYKIYTKEC